VNDIVQVVGAVIERDGLIFCTQRATGPLAGLWEFPGGKVEPGETKQEALRREILEELEGLVIVGDQVASGVWKYDHVTIALTTFRCKLETNSVPRLSEHSAAQWVAPAALGKLEWAPADIASVRAIEELAAIRGSLSPGRVRPAYGLRSR